MEESDWIFVHFVAVMTYFMDIFRRRSTNVLHLALILSPVFCSLMCRFPDWSHAGCWNMTTLMLLWWIYFIFLLLMLYCKKAALQVTRQIFQCNSSQLFLYGDVNTHKTIFLDKIIQLLYCIYKMLVQLTSSLLKKVFFSVRHNFDKIHLDLGCWLFV